jgi:hypothetical protein
LPLPGGRPRSSRRHLANGSFAPTFMTRPSPRLVARPRRILGDAAHPTAESRPGRGVKRRGRRGARRRSRHRVLARSCVDSLRSRRTGARDGSSSRALWPSSASDGAPRRLGTRPRGPLLRGVLCARLCRYSRFQV